MVNLSRWMLPLKPLLSPKMRFQWSDELDEAFTKSKEEIIQAIKEGVSIFYPKKPTCLRTDWSTSGIGFFLGQKHCECNEVKIGCWKDGWRITLAGLRFLRPSETRFAPVEGESLGLRANTIFHPRLWTTYSGDKPQTTSEIIRWSNFGWNQ